MQRNQHYQSNLEQIQEAAGEQDNLISLHGSSVQHLVDVSLNKTFDITSSSS